MSYFPEVKILDGAGGVNTANVSNGALEVQGAAAADAAQVGNPVLVGGVDSSGNIQELGIGDKDSTAPVQVLLVGGQDKFGRVEPIPLGNTCLAVLSQTFFSADNVQNSAVSGLLETNQGSPAGLIVGAFNFNGATYDRPRNAGIGNNAVSTGIVADVPYGQFNTTPPTTSSGNYTALQTDYEGSLFVKPFRRAQTVSQATTITSASAQTVLAAQAAGIFADISNLLITVTPQAATDIAFTITLSDGTANYVFDMDTGALATATADPTIINVNFNPPLPATNAATAWTQTNSSATPTTHTTIVAILQKAS